MEKEENLTKFGTKFAVSLSIATMLGFLTSCALAPKEDSNKQLQPFEYQEMVAKTNVIPVKNESLSEDFEKTAKNWSKFVYDEILITQFTWDRSDQGGKFSKTLGISDKLEIINDKEKHQLYVPVIITNEILTEMIVNNLKPLKADKDQQLWSPYERAIYNETRMMDYLMNHFYATIRLKNETTTIRQLLTTPRGYTVVKYDEKDSEETLKQKVFQATGLNFYEPISENALK